MNVSNWVKRMGQWHLAKLGETKTLCGRPMLGNNYDLAIPEKKREKCDECWREVDDEKL